MSADDNLRDALIREWQLCDIVTYWGGCDTSINFDVMANIAIRVIKDWTADKPLTDPAKAMVLEEAKREIECLGVNTWTVKPKS